MITTRELAKTIIMTVTLQHDDSDHADDTSPLLLTMVTMMGRKAYRHLWVHWLAEQIPVMEFSFREHNYEVICTDVPVLWMTGPKFAGLNSAKVNKVIKYVPSGMNKCNMTVASPMYVLVKLLLLEQAQLCDDDSQVTILWAEKD